MLKSRTFLTLLSCLCTIGAYAQTTAPAGAPATGAETRPKHEPPPNAYADCKGKKAGDAVQHQTPEGVVAAKCADSPKGLVARPDNPTKNRPAKSPS